MGLAIRFTRLATLERAINRRYAGRVCGEDKAAIIFHGGKLARVVRATARYGFFRAKCLEQSLALWCLLRRKGVAAEIRFGARKNGTHFEAHAWVEYRGTVLDQKDPLVVQFVRFAEPLVSPR